MNLIKSIKANLGLRKVIVLGIMFFVIFFGFQSVLNLKKVSSLDNVNLQVEIKACESSISNPYCEIVPCEDSIKNDCTSAEETKWNAMRIYTKKCDLDTSKCDALQNKVRNILYPNSNNNNNGGGNLPQNNMKLSNTEKDYLLSLIHEDNLRAALDYTMSKESNSNAGSVVINDNNRGPSFGLFQFNRDGEMSKVSKFIFQNNPKIKSNFNQHFIELVTNSKGKIFNQNDINNLKKLGSLSSTEQILFKEKNLKDLIILAKNYLTDDVKYNDLLTNKKATIAIFDINNQMGGRGFRGALIYANSKKGNLAQNILDGAVQNMVDRNIAENIIKGTSITLADSRKSRNQGILSS